VTDVRREQAAIRRRILLVLAERRAAGVPRQSERVPLAQASISSTTRMPTDS
jgi:hypothetical protein